MLTVCIPGGMYVTVCHCKYVCVYAWYSMSVTACMHVCVYGWMDVCMTLCTYVWMAACLPVCMCVTACVCEWCSVHVCYIMQYDAVCVRHASLYVRWRHYACMSRCMYLPLCIYMKASMVPACLQVRVCMCYGCM